jgi:hypothetical protein
MNFHLVSHIAVLVGARIVGTALISEGINWITRYFQSFLFEQLMLSLLLVETHLAPELG